MREMKDSGVEWIGEIPVDWNCCKQKFEIQLINGRAFKDSEFEYDGKYPILRVGNLFSNPTWYTSSLELSPDKYCKKGDLLYSWSMSYAPIIWQGDKVIFHYHIWKVLLNSGINKKYVYYYLLTLTDAIKAEIHETTMGFITMGVMNNSAFAFPQTTEQEAIASFLDSKCAEIDALTTDIQKEIETLQEYRKSVITEAVTKGLDPDVEMKDSGILWVPLAPKTWEISRIGHVCQKLERCFSPDDIPLLCTNKGKIVIRPEEMVGIMVSQDNAMQGIRKGDIAIHGMDTWHGLIAISNIDGKITRVVHVCNSCGDNRFIVYYLQSLAFNNVYKLISNGVRGNTSDFRSWNKVEHILIPIPNIEEQHRICDYLDEKCNEIDSIIADKQKQLETLAEYRKSLIYEYVTGKKEIPTA